MYYPHSLIKLSSLSTYNADLYHNIGVYKHGLVWYLEFKIACVLQSGRLKLHKVETLAQNTVVAGFLSSRGGKMEIREHQGGGDDG